MFGPADNVFKAHVEHNETEEAETILEGGETEVEKPVDEEEAEEVVEEEEEEEHDGQQRDEPPARISKVAGFTVYTGICTVTGFELLTNGLV